VTRNRDRSEKSNKKQMIASSYIHIVPAGTFATPQERGYIECPCPKDCTLHGECFLCVAYHGRKGRLPRCER